VWIDPELRSFVNAETTAQNRATNDECEPEAPAVSLPQKGIFAGQLSITPVRWKEMEVKARSAMRFSWVVVALWVLLNTAWADVAGRISGMVSDPSGAFVAGATDTLNNVGNGTNQTTITNGQGQYSFPVVPVGRYELEVSSPGFQPYKKVAVLIDVNSALQIDVTLQIGQNTQTVEVNDSFERPTGAGKHTAACLPAEKLKVSATPTKYRTCLSSIADGSRLSE
jgi:hypothetical protein